MFDLQISELDNVESNVDIVRSAVAEVVDAREAIKAVLGTALALANHLNASATTKPTVGVKLRNLVEVGKIESVVADSGKKRTVMDYVVQVFHELSDEEPVSRE